MISTRFIELIISSFWLVSVTHLAYAGSPQESDSTKFNLEALNYSLSYDEQVSDLAVAKIIWLRNDLVSYELQEYPDNFLRDCSLVYAVIANLTKDESDFYQTHLLNSKSSAFKSASNNFSESSPFEKKVLNTLDRVETMELILPKISACEEAVNPIFDRFQHGLKGGLIND